MWISRSSLFSEDLVGSSAATASMAKFLWAETSIYRAGGWGFGLRERDSEINVGSLGFRD